MFNRNWVIRIAIAGLLLFGGCSQTVGSTPPFPETQTANISTPPASQTATRVPTDTPTATFTLIPTPTPIVHPLMISVMREQSYPGSELVFEETLTPGANYDRYVVSYQSEGNTIYALLTIPRGEPPPTGWPVIVFNHGYIPPDVYRTTERYVAYVDTLALNGYIVIKSDYRGHGFSEGHATGGYSSPAYTVDVLNALASIKQYPLADPDRIGMWGHSMGGQITLRSMVVVDDIKAGVIWAGVVGSYPDLLLHWRRPRDPNQPTRTPDPNTPWRSWRLGLSDRYGDPDENPEFWASISPNSYVSDLSGPIQLHHGTADTSVPVILSELLFHEVQEAGIPVEFYLYPDDDHNISTSFVTAMQRTVQFFDTYVKNGQ